MKDTECVNTVADLMRLMTAPAVLKHPRKYFGEQHALTLEQAVLEQHKAVALYRGRKGLTLVGFELSAYAEFLHMLLPGWKDRTSELVTRLPTPALLTQEDGTIPLTTSRPAVRYGSVVLVPWATLRHHLRPWLHTTRGHGGSKVTRALEKTLPVPEPAPEASVAHTTPPRWRHMLKKRQERTVELHDYFNVVEIQPAAVPHHSVLAEDAADGAHVLDLLAEDTELTVWLLTDPAGERFVLFGPTFARTREAKLQRQLSRFALPRVSLTELRHAHALAPLTQQDVLGHGLALITYYGRDCATLMKHDVFLSMLRA